MSERLVGKDRVGVCIPVRRGDTWTAAAESLHLQTHWDYEVHVDDGPDTPGSPADKRNRLLAHVRSRGLALVLVLDADCRLANDTLARWIALLRDNPQASWVSSSFLRTGALDGVQGPVPIPGDGWPSSVYSPGAFYTGSPCLVRADDCVAFPERPEWQRTGDQAWYRAMMDAGHVGVLSPSVDYQAFYRVGDLSVPSS